jgi:hypothetical protein
MKLSAKPKYFFTPDWNGNLSLPEDQRVKIEIIRPTAENRGNLIYYETTQEVSAAKTTKDITVKSVTIKTKFNVSEILRHHVGAVMNLEVEETSTALDAEKNPTESVAVKKILTGEDLAVSVAYGINRLIDKICNEVTSDILTEAEKKSS